MEEYKKPDLNAPRFRPKKLNLLNKDFYNRFRLKNAKYSNLSDKEIKEIITLFNGEIWKNVIENRDGVALPEQLGNIFIGSCTKKVSTNTDYKKSGELGYRVQNQNWESDQFIAKIFYTNYESKYKYKFRFQELWGFSALRDFKRAAGGDNYRNNWKKYIVVDGLQRVSQLFNKETFKQYLKIEENKKLDSYDEFDFS